LQLLPPPLLPLLLPLLTWLALWVLWRPPGPQYQRPPGAYWEVAWPQGASPGLVLVLVLVLVLGLGAWPLLPSACGVLLLQQEASLQQEQQGLGQAAEA
jgi:hypothetical protein